MPRPRPTARLAALLAPALLAFAACDGGGTERGVVRDAPRAEAPPAPRPPAPSATPADAAAPRPERRPNVVLVTVDTLRADALGAYGSERPTSPNLDRLAAGGVLFEQCVASSPSTLPSHASLFTGLQPYDHGLRANAGYALPERHRTLAEAFREAGYATGAEVAAAIITRRVGFQRGFSAYRDVESDDAERRTLGEGLRRVVLPERPAGDVTDKGIAFVRRHRDAPFFLWLHYFDPHAPYTPPPEFARRIPDSPYHAEVAHTDHALGRFVDALERLGLADGTLLVVTSDHGEGLGEHGEQTHSFLVYDSTMRVPLILWGPDALARGRRVPALVRTIDVAPTVLDAAGLPPLPGAEGVSLWPLATGAAPPASADGVAVAYGESIEARTAFGASALRFVRVGPWKYIHKTNPELYDLSRDPRERTNRLEAEPERARALRDRLGALLEDGSAAGARVDVDDAEAARLRSLGYVSTPAGADAEHALATLQVSGADPNALLDDVDRLARAASVLDAGDAERAAALFAELGARHPGSLHVLRGWIDALRALGRPAEAVPLLERAVGLAPGDTGLRVKLVASLLEAGRPGEAEPHARRAVAERPCGELETTYLSAVLRATDRREAQRDFLAEAVSRCESDAIRNEYAWLLATSADDALRDGARALRIAREITARPAGARPEYLDTLAAARAEAGDLAGAVATQRRALAALERHGVPESRLAVFRAHLAAFLAGRPVRD